MSSRSSSTISAIRVAWRKIRPSYRERSASMPGDGVLASNTVQVSPLVGRNLNREVGRVTLRGAGEHLVEHSFPLSACGGDRPVLLHIRLSVTAHFNPELVVVEEQLEELLGLLAG